MTHPNLGDQPAFPHGPLGDTMHGEDGREWHQFPAGTGMPLRSYAAIALRIPDSGDPILNVMIHDAQRRDIAALALQGLLASGESPTDDDSQERAVKAADSLLIELAKEKP